jgi:chemotaxis protein methyltransferase CheR
VALELLRSDRFGEALAWLDRLAADDDDDAQVLLLRAVLLVHRGQLPDAERACRRLLAIDELSAGAHHVLAQCREGASDWQGAREHDQIAVYLDPSFAMARLHLGLLARRDGPGSGGEAQRELSHALHLLQTEDASRLLLFGGGFTRESLLALCRRELQACGGKA